MEAAGSIGVFTVLIVTNIATAIALCAALVNAMIWAKEAGLSREQMTAARSHIGTLERVTMADRALVVRLLDELHGRAEAETEDIEE